MQQRLGYIKGLQSDLSPTKTDPDSYSDAYNVSLETDETGTIGSITNERGTKKLFEMPSGHKINGWAAFQNYIIIFSSTSGVGAKGYIWRLEYNSETDSIANLAYPLIPTTYTLTLVVGTNGSVRCPYFNNYGLTTPGIYYASVDSGKIVPFEAIYDTNCKFVKWTDASNTTIETALNHSETMTSDKTVKAVFREKYQYPFTLNVGTGGTVITNLLAGGAPRLPGTYNTIIYEDDVHTLKAIADTGYSFQGWSGNSIQSIEPEISFTSDGEKVFNANFVAYKVLSLRIHGNAVVTVNGVAYELQNNWYQISMPINSTVELYTNPYLGWQFYRYVINGQFNNNQYLSFSMNENKTIESYSTLI